MNKEITKVYARNLTVGDVAVFTGEKVLAVTNTRTTNPKYDRTHRAVCLENAEGVQRWAEWNASTLITVER